MWRQFNDVPLNSEMVTQPVSTEGYSESDLNGYYSGTFLLRISGDTVEPVFIRGMDGISNMHVAFLLSGGEEDNARVPVSELYRFVVPKGFYNINGALSAFNYKVSRSYKKGLSRDFMEFSNRTSMNMLKTMYSLVYDAPLQGVERISRRLIIKDGRIHTLHKNLSVGRCTGASVDTGFPAVRQRIEEARNA